VIGGAVNPGHVCIIIKYSPEYCVSYMSKIIEVRSAKVPRRESPHLTKLC